MGVEEDVVEYFRPLLEGGRAGDNRGELKPEEVCSVNTRSLMLTNSLKRAQNAKLRSRDLKVVRRAIQRRFERGGYGVDFLHHSVGKDLFAKFEKSEGRETVKEMVNEDVDFVAESVERDTEEEVQLARESNELSMATGALRRYGSPEADLDGNSSVETTPELEGGRGSSRNSSPLDVWDMQQLKVTLPTSAAGFGARSQARALLQKQMAPVAGWEFDWECLGEPVRFE